MKRAARTGIVLHMQLAFSSIYQSTLRPLCREASACHPGSIGKYASLHADEVVPLLERLAIIEMFVPGTLATHLSA